MLGEQEPDAGALQRIDQRQHLAAGNAEGMGRARSCELAGQKVGSRHEIAWERGRVGRRKRIVAHAASPARRGSGLPFRNRATSGFGYILTEM